MKALVISVFALLFTVGTSVAQTLEDANAKYQSAIEKFQSKSFAEAVPLLQEAMKLGVAVGTEESKELVKEVQKLIPQAQLYSGVLAAQQNRLDDAIEALLQAEETADLYNNTNVRRQASRLISNVYQQKGIDAFNSKEYAVALESFLKGYEQDPSNIELTSFTAKAYAELGQLDKAAPLFQAIIDAGANNSKYAELSASALKDVDNYFLSAMSAASSDMDKVISIAEYVPANPKAALIVIQTANNLKKLDIVIARGAAAADLQTDLAFASDIYYMMGTAYALKENKAKAIEVLSKVTAGSSVAAAKSLITELKK